MKGQAAGKAADATAKQDDDALLKEQLGAYTKSTQKNDDGDGARAEKSNGGIDDSYTEDDGAAGDADDDDNAKNPSSWKKKIFGKKKTMRRKKFGKAPSASSGAAGGGDGSVASSAPSGGDELGMDDSIAAPYPGQQLPGGQGGGGNGKPRHRSRQRAKVAMYPANKYMDNSESDCQPDRGLEPMDAAMEAALPHRRQTQRRQHSNPRGSRDPPTGATPQAGRHQQRRKKRGNRADGYENSGHETSDFPFTEDDKSDYHQTEDDRDNDDEEDKDIDGIVHAVAKKLSLVGSEDDSNGVEGGDKNKKSLVKDPKEEKPSRDEKPSQPQQVVDPQSQTMVPQSKGKKKRSPRKRHSKPKKGLPQTVQEDNATATVQEDAPAKTTPGQQQEEESEKKQQNITQEGGDDVVATPAKKKGGDQGQVAKNKQQQHKQSNKRTPKSKGEPKTAAEEDDAPISMQQEEELDCHTPMKTTLKQQQSEQTPKKPRKRKGKAKGQKQQQKDVIEEEEKQLHQAHEDEDDYPASMLCQPANEDAGKEESKSGSAKKKQRPPRRSIKEELAFLKRISPTRYQVNVGFVPNMKVPAEIIVNNDLETLLVQELHDSCCGPKANVGGFIPSLKQAANVAALPGIVKSSMAMPDVHSGYGFCIGNVAAFDMEDPEAVISPGGVGFDINCGVRLIRTNLTEDQVGEDVREKLAEAMFRNIPVGVGAGGDIPCNMKELDSLLREGINWAVDKGYAWEEDRDHCEENGKMDTADPKCVSNRAKKRGLKQIGTLGAGNHYAEIQVVEEIYHPEAADAMGIGKLGQVCVMIHTGSRGLGHQVATDALQVMERAMARDKIDLNDRQLSCARISSREGKEYLAAMSSAANFAWVNRSCITYLTRKAFSEVFDRTPLDMDMHMIYDVCHNIAKVERHVVDGKERTLLVHRKGSTRAFPPEHPNIPEDYRSIGQPVLIGGTMGTCSYVLVGTEKGMTETFGSTCHGAGRALSRNQSRKQLNHNEVLQNLKENGISIRVASPKLVMEEAPESYKNVCDVVETCQDAGISKKVVKLRPIAVIKG